MNITLKQMQSLELEIALEVNRICIKHGLKLFLEGGTFLGAIRHKGFIPWDDDMDFGLIWDDYTTLLRVIEKELDSRFYIMEWSKNRNYPHPYIKVCLKDTLVKEKEMFVGDSNQGIWIDVFPYIPVNSGFFWGFKELEGKIYSRIYAVQCGYFSSSKLITLLSKLFSKKFISRRYRRYIEKLPCQNSNKCVVLDDYIQKRYLIDTEVITNLIPYRFEEKQFWGVDNFNEYLEKYYGDYMSLPPENER